MRTNATLNLEIKPTISATLHLNSNNSPTTRYLTDTNFVSNSITFRHGTSQSDEFTVGGAVIGSLSFTLMNDTGTFDGIDWYDARVSVNLIAKDTSNQDVTIDMGYYYVAKHHEQGNFITVECYDALKVLDEYQLHELRINGQEISDAQWEAGFTIPQLVALIATKIGLAISNVGGSNIIVHNPNNPQMTLRAALSYLAQMAGQYITVNYGGSALVFGWYDTSSIHDAGTTFNHDLRTGNITITGVQVSDYKDETVVTHGSSTYQLKIADNPFIDANNANTVASNIGSAVEGISFRPGSATILASPAYQPGDMLRIATGQESNINFLVTNLTYKLQVTESVTADAEPYEGDLRIDNLAYIKKQAQKAAQDEISNELDEPASDLSEAIANAGGTKTFFLKQNIVTLSSNVTVSRLNASGLENVSTSYTAYHIGGHMVTVPSYAQTLQGTREFFVPIRCDLQTVYAGVAMFRAKWISDHEIRFFDGGESAKGVWFMDARNTPVIFWVRAHLWSTSNTAVFDLDRNEWTGT